MIKNTLYNLRSFILNPYAFKDEKGQGMVEYGLILALIALVVIVIMGITGHQVQNTFSKVDNGLKPNP